ncbi:response regulator, partial [Patescibacteria group bacterium]|nr:response regulator [Patescibacteria group bacterium]
MYCAKVLIIEDEKDLAHTLRDALSSERPYPYDSRIALDGEDGLKLALNWRPDIILLDLALPKLHGLSILRKIRYELSTTKICIISGQDSLEDKLAGFREGSDDYLVKPFSYDELMARIRAL